MSRPNLVLQFSRECAINGARIGVPSCFALFFFIVVAPGCGFEGDDIACRFDVDCPESYPYCKSEDGSESTCSTDESFEGDVEVSTALPPGLLEVP